MVDHLYLGAYRLLGVLFRLLPRRGLIWFMRGLARFAYLLDTKHRRIIDANLTLAFDDDIGKEERKAIALGSYINLFDTFFGIIARENMEKAKVIENIVFEGEEIVRRVRESGKKLIFVTGHYGNWELISQALAIKFDLTLVGVGRELDSKLMDERLKRNRERFNVEMVYKRGAMKGCIQALNADKAVGILVDQSLPLSQGIEIDFFSHKATHTTLASILARRYESDIIPVFIHTEDYLTYKATIHEPIPYQKSDEQEADILAMTQAQADIMERVIRQDPRQWFWQHKRWKVFYSGIYRQYR